MHNWIKKIDRTAVYSVALPVVILLIILYALVESWQDEIRLIFFNPFWTIAIVWIDYILQNNEKQVAKDNQKKLDSLSGIIRRSVDIDSTAEQRLIEAILDAVGTDNLMLINADKVKERKLKERVEDIKVQQTTPENLTP